ncbi:MAG: hypothetical protein V2I97_19860 [Desulfococcaceae bacterium]|jgi:hypothetical protein|nr:hypothetical protein [Desulfococcaceae bacterium]
MEKNIESTDIEQLLAEADDLMQQINSDAIIDMEEDDYQQFERHSQNLKQIKSDVQGRMGKKETSEKDSGAEGVHEAILDIVKAMRGMKKKK